MKGDSEISVSMAPPKIILQHSPVKFFQKNLHHFPLYSGLTNKKISISFHNSQFWLLYWQRQWTICPLLFLSCQSTLQVSTISHLNYPIFRVKLYLPFSYSPFRSCCTSLIMLLAALLLSLNLFLCFFFLHPLK